MTYRKDRWKRRGGSLTAKFVRPKSRRCAIADRPATETKPMLGRGRFVGKKLRKENRRESGVPVTVTWSSRVRTDCETRQIRHTPCTVRYGREKQGACSARITAILRRRRRRRRTSTCSRCASPAVETHSFIFVFSPFPSPIDCCVVRFGRVYYSQYARVPLAIRRPRVLHHEPELVHFVSVDIQIIRSNVARRTRDKRPVERRFFCHFLLFFFFLPFFRAGNRGGIEPNRNSFVFVFV